MDSKYSKDIMDRIQGMIFGHALGDALGAPHEFRYQKKNYNGQLIHPIVIQNQWQGVKTSAIGQITDDTEMSLCLWNVILDCQSYDIETALEYYLEWANTKGTWAMGKNTRSLFKGVKTIGGYKKRYEKICAPSNVSQSNGSLMRCYPLAILALMKLDWKQAIVEDCNLTNPNPMNRLVEKLYIGMIIMALKGKTKDQINKKLYKLVDKQEQELKNILMPIILLPDISAKKWISTYSAKGWCVTAFSAAVWGLFGFDSYKTAIDAIVTRGGDADTNAAIAGALLGAFYGLKKLKKNKYTRKNLEVLVSADTNKGELPRPEKYTLYNIDNLIEDVRRIIFKSNHESPHE